MIRHFGGKHKKSGNKKRQETRERNPTHRKTANFSITERTSAALDLCSRDKPKRSQGPDIYSTSSFQPS